MSTNAKVQPARELRLRQALASFIKDAEVREDYAAVSAALRAADEDAATRVCRACNGDAKLAGLMLSFGASDSEFSVLDAVLVDDADESIRRIEVGNRLQAKLSQRFTKP